MTVRTFSGCVQYSAVHVLDCSRQQGTLAYAVCFRCRSNPCTTIHACRLLRGVKCHVHQPDQTVYSVPGQRLQQYSNNNVVEELCLCACTCHSLFLCSVNAVLYAIHFDHVDIHVHTMGIQVMCMDMHGMDMHTIRSTRKMCDKTF
eukprot:scpid106555/ scgid0433/ 